MDAVPCELARVVGTELYRIPIKKSWKIKHVGNALESYIKKLVLDDDVTKKAGIIPFILSDRTWRDEKHPPEQSQK